MESRVFFERLFIHIVEQEALSPLGGGQRKAHVVVSIGVELLADYLKVPLPRFVRRFLVSLIVDAMVFVLNKVFGHRWLDALRSKDQKG
ncbi:MAG: hypothetical protein QXI02_02960 [Candidatus Caldarchaeum sp.]